MADVVVSMPPDMAEAVDEALSLLLQARSTPYAWGGMREDPAIAAALRDVHILLFAARVDRAIPVKKVA